jgi:hypothetical protein
MAEAENWSRLSKEVSRRGWGKKRLRHLVRGRGGQDAFQYRQELHEKWH